MPKLCLNMIMKNEMGVLPRLLDSVAPHIDAWVVCDTGSTDGSDAYIEQYMQARGIPGELHRFAFENFEYARNRALKLAKASPLQFDYVLFTDADMQLVVKRPNWKNEIIAPAYQVLLRHPTNASGNELEYPQPRIIHRNVHAVFKGLTHEYLDLSGPPGGQATFAAFYDGVLLLEHGGGGNRPTKFQRDFELLSLAVQQDPTDARSTFYLANTLFDIGRYQEAIDMYRRRASQGGWIEERFYSSYRIACCFARLENEAELTREVLDCYQRYPHRAEALHLLASWHLRNQKHRLSFLFAELASKITKPDGALFVEPDVYRWRCKDVMAVSLYYLNDQKRSLELNHEVLALCPDADKPRIQDNISWSQKAMRGEVTPKTLS
jgi:tetratricopeptide (TPR) repeat protein